MKIKADGLPIKEVPAKGSKIFCPRCDKPYSGKDNQTYTELLNLMKNHVLLQHPDHDPEWFDTFPTPE